MNVILKSNGEYASVAPGVDIMAEAERLGGTVVDAADLPEHLEPVVVPERITRRQGRLALLQAGHLADVEAAMAALADPIERMAAQIEYEAETWERSNPWIERTGAAVGLSAEQIDELFIRAASL